MFEIVETPLYNYWVADLAGPERRRLDPAPKRLRSASVDAIFSIEPVHPRPAALADRSSFLTGVETSVRIDRMEFQGNGASSCAGSVAQQR